MGVLEPPLKTQARDLFDAGVVAHPLVDSFFHIQRSTLGTDNEIAHSPIIGHLFEWTTPDKTFLDSNKAEQSFRALVSAAYEFSVGAGLTNLSAQELNRSQREALSRLKSITQQVEALPNRTRTFYIRGEPIETTLSPRIPRRQQAEFDLLFQYARELGLPDIRPEGHAAAGSLRGLLEQLDTPTLRGILGLPLGSFASSLSKNFMVKEIERRYIRRIQRVRDWNYQYFLEHVDEPVALQEGEDMSVEKDGL